MRKFKFRLAFSAYTTLIGALSAVHESDLMLPLFHQMEELGYEVDAHLFTTLIRVGKVDIAWKFFHEMKADGLAPDDVTYTSMIGVLCKANRLDEAVELYEQMATIGKFHVYMLIKP
ncbi:hypothetical protein Patl1_01211 [Pistacia atlantica]|uniref:Uncharacterized protein n=1 Tax=Pistacia atlantica TaxID=434234 RepID=A0ACC1C8C4_9ROSI|nr:hypothetical protein Patl1_01211 [Pistacia atlantica]